MPRPLASSLLALVLTLACATPPAPMPAMPTPPPKAITAIEGMVRNPEGAPVEGALVALIPMVPDWRPLRAPPAGRVRTTPEGRFRIEGMPGGAYALSVTAPGLTTLFRPGLTLAEGESLRNVDLAMEREGHLVRGTMTRAEGGALEDAWVIVARMGKREGAVAYVRPEPQGDWSVLLPPGDYSVSGTAPGRSPHSFGVRVDKPQNLKLVLDTLPVSTPPAPEVLAWLKSAAVPLATVEAGHGFSDLRPLKPWLQGARVVALGEATHGSREFFQLKHRLLEYLVTEQGFTLFGIEASFAEALAVNEYVLTGKGDPAAVLAGLDIWTWDTEEVLALLRWMRAYNAEPSHPRKLRFLGFDMQRTSGSARALLAFLGQVDPPLAQRAREPLALLGENKAPLGSSKQPDAATLERSAQVLAEVESRLKAEHPRYALKTSEREWTLAVRHTHLLTRLVAAMRGDEASGLLERERMMADTLLWSLEQEGPGAKMVVWAHNAHVASSSYYGGDVDSMGQLLRRALGDSLYVFGFAFDQGSFRALSRQRQGEPLTVMTHTVPPAPEGSLDAVLASVGPPLLALDLRGAPDTGPVAAFLHERRETRESGGTYFEGMPLTPVRLAGTYDGLLFVERTQASVPTPKPASATGNP